MARIEEASADRPVARWPAAVGITGIVVAVLMFVDKIDDLLVLLLTSPEQWSRWLGAEQAELAVQLMPPMGWVVVAAVIGGVLAVVLFIGSMRLRQRLASGIELCRRWSQVTIAWAVIEITAAIWWIQRNQAFISDMAGAEWQGAAVFAVVVALAVMVAFPVFLLIWLARPEIKREYAAWAPG